MRWFRSEPDLSKIHDDISELQRGFRSLRLEWSDTLDKLSHRLQRIAATYQRMAESEETLTTEGGPELSESDRLTLSRLPPAQRAVQTQIILQRKAGRPNGR